MTERSQPAPEAPGTESPLGGLGSLLGMQPLFVTGAALSSTLSASLAMFDYPRPPRVASGAMDPGELRRELEQLAADARAHRERLAELGAKISTACELVSTVRSTLRGDAGESTPASRDAQGQVEDARAAGT